MRLFLSIIICVISLLVGLFLFLKPPLAIEIQRRFYEKINWRIEPISMQKEIRNTKIMGLMLIVIMVLLVNFVFIIKIFK